MEVAVPDVPHNGGLKAAGIDVLAGPQQALREAGDRDADVGAGGALFFE